MWAKTMLFNQSNEISSIHDGVEKTADTALKIAHYKELEKN